MAAAGAAGFLTRLIAQDDITDWLRERWKVFWIIALGPTHRWNRPGVGKLQKVIGCHRCVGTWMSLGTFTVAWVSGGAAWFVWPALALSAAFVNSLLMEAVSR